MAGWKSTHSPRTLYNQFKLLQSAIFTYKGIIYEQTVRLSAAFFSL